MKIVMKINLIMAVLVVSLLMPLFNSAAAACGGIPIILECEVATNRFMIDGYRAFVKTNAEMPPKLFKTARSKYACTLSEVQTIDIKGDPPPYTLTYTILVTNILDETEHALQVILPVESENLAIYYRTGVMSASLNYHRNVFDSRYPLTTNELGVTNNFYLPYIRDKVTSELSPYLID